MNSEDEKIIESTLNQLKEEVAVEKKIEVTLRYIKFLIPNSSTRESLKPDGYPESGIIEQTIRTYQKETKNPYEHSLRAIETRCGNCQEMAYTSGLLLRAIGFTGSIQVAEFGINHAFLIVDDYIVDAWADKYFPFSTWKDNLEAYGGSIKEGIMKGRVLSANHFELEDENPEVSQSIPELNQCLPSAKERERLMILIGQALLNHAQNLEEQPSIRYSSLKLI